MDGSTRVKAGVSPWDCNPFLMSSSGFIPHSMLGIVQVTPVHLEEFYFEYIQ